MAGELHDVTFAELVGGRENVIGGPFGSNLTSADYTSSGVPVVRGSNMNGRYLSGEFAYVSPDKAAALATNQIDAGDLLVTQRGTLGQVSIAPERGPANYVVSQSQMGVHVEGADRLFVYYLLTSHLFRSFLDAAAIQTGVPHINLGLLRNWRVRVPTVKEQSRIAHLLGVLDDRIELNQRMVETLEAAVRGLFKSWFIDFDPVRARHAGQPTGLPEDLSGLFPVAMGDDGVPKGWSVRPIGDLFEVRGGNTPSTQIEENWGDRHEWATPKDLSTLSVPVLLQTERKITDMGLTRSTSGLLPPGSLLLSTRAPIGYMAFATRPVAINQGFAGFLRKEVSTIYAWCWCAANMNQIIGNASGSTFAEISKAVLRKLPILAPSPKVLDAFEKAAAPLVARMVETVEQSATLASLRDSLLPRLISGELRIRDAERAAAG
jgi:type I restriction enzyme S subunit